MLTEHIPNRPHLVPVLLCFFVAVQYDGSRVTTTDVNAHLLIAVVMVRVSEWHRVQPRGNMTTTMAQLPYLAAGANLARDFLK